MSPSVQPSLAHSSLHRSASTELQHKRRHFITVQQHQRHHLSPLTRDFRIDWKTVECPTLTGRPPLVRITPRDMAVRWHPCRWSDASGVMALPWRLSVAHAQPSLIWELQWRLKWKKRIQVEGHWLPDTVHAHYLDRPSVKIDRQDSQRETTPSIIPNSLAKRGVIEGTHYTFMNSGEKTIQNLINSNLYDPPRDQH